MNNWLPLDTVLETETLLAYRHPTPSYPIHFLLIPRQQVANFMELDAGQTSFLTDLVQVLQRLVEQFGLEERGYRLICNGGPYQDVGFLHFHLVAGEPG